MLTDNDLLCSSAQAVTADAVSDKSIDLTTARDIGPGTTIEPFLLVTEDFATTVSIDFSVITSAAAALTSPTKLYTKNVLLAGLTAGTYVKFPPVPAGVAQRYLGFDYNVNTDATAGKVTAGFTIQGAKPANNGVTA